MIITTSGAYLQLKRRAKNNNLIPQPKAIQKDT
jgi:hypothetical protein